MRIGWKRLIHTQQRLRDRQVRAVAARVGGRRKRSNWLRRDQTWDAQRRDADWYVCPASWWECKEAVGGGGGDGGANLQLDDWN